MTHPSYAAILRDAERARWSVEDATAGLLDLDFDKPFLPEALVHAERLPFLLASERVRLTQIRAHAYVRLAALSEKLVLPFVMTQAAGCLHGDSERLLALMGHGHQAAKHITLFERFAAAFERGFDTPCEIVGPAEDINARFLTNDTLAVGLLVLHFECVTQTHYLRAARGGGELDAQLEELLRLHWREEAQNARLVALVLGELVEQSSPHERARAVQQYVGMLDELSSAFLGQAELDLAAFERAARPLGEDERRQWMREQSPSYDEVFLHHGVEHPIVRRTIAAHFGGPFPELDEAARRFRAVAHEDETAPPKIHGGAGAQLDTPE